MTYDEIWQQYRDDPRFTGVTEPERRRIHLKWKQLAAEVK